MYISVPESGDVIGEYVNMHDLSEVAWYIHSHILLFTSIA